MEKLKEYAAMMAAVFAIVMGMGALGLWVINAQVIPEFNRLDGRIDNYETLYTEIKGRLDRMDNRFTRLDRRLERRFDRIDSRFGQIDDRLARIDERFEQIDDRFKQIDNRFLRLESGVNRRFDEMAANMKVILSKLSSPAGQGGN